MRYCKAVLVWTLLVFWGSGLSCSQMKPAPYHPVSEVPEGPGLVTGKAGAIIIGGKSAAEETPSPPHATSTTANPSGKK